MLNEQELLTILQKYQSEAYYVGNKISTKQLKIVRSKFSIPHEEKIIAMVDSTVLKSSKTGLAFGLSAMYSNKVFLGEALHPRKAITYEEFKNSNIRFTNKSDGGYKGILIGEDFMIDLAGSHMKRELLIEILEDLQSFLQSKTVKESNQQIIIDISSNKEAYWIANNGKQLGPYNGEKIQDLVRRGELNIHYDYIWKQGMPQWELISDFKELNLQVSSPPSQPVSRKQTLNQDIRFLEIPFDVNKAAEHDLLTLPGIDLMKAQKLCEWRLNKGHITSYDILRELWDVQPHEFEEIKTMIKNPNHKTSNTSS